MSAAMIDVDLHVEHVGRLLIDEARVHADATHGRQRGAADRVARDVRRGNIHGGPR
jgi:hypothetical protein